MINDRMAEGRLKRKRKSRNWSAWMSNDSIKITKRPEFRVQEQQCSFTRKETEAMGPLSGKMLNMVGKIEVEG